MNHQESRAECSVTSFLDCPDFPFVVESSFYSVFSFFFSFFFRIHISGTFKTPFLRTDDTEADYGSNEPTNHSISFHSLLSLLMEHMFLFVYDQPPYKVFAITCHHQRNANRVALSKFTASMTFDLSREHETKRPPNIRRPSPLPIIKSAPPHHSTFWGQTQCQTTTLQDTDFPEYSFLRYSWASTGSGSRENW